MSRVSSSSSSAGVARPSYPRAQARVPVASQSYATRVVYTPVYTSYTPYRKGYSGTNMAMSMIGGYYLGRMMSRPWGYGGYGYPYYGGYYGGSPYYGYVPYRERYHDYFTTTMPPTGMLRVTTPAQAKDIDLCTLARWNRELPYSEVPNMALLFLSNDTVSGNTTADKAKFVYEFFNELPRAYASYNSSGDIFTIPAAYDLKKCNIQNTEGADVTQPPAANTVEEPILTAARNVINLYSNVSKVPDNLPDLVTAARACIPRSDNIAHPEVLACLDFSVTPDQLVSLSEAKSMFSNGEICRKQLNPDMLKCVPSGDTATCRLEHLVALNLFARNYYMCTAELEEETARRIRERTEEEAYWYGNGANNNSAFILFTLLTATITIMMDAFSLRR
ncbi:uncharacterized protein LOC129594798 isoform X2 [Paramacrobiotus metropolitanus]|uniref:uncharacterized protein LOC129594798 isoform X2 n=1 Tax=Paramacrobiotus metropolitanus TaxID=2943436 RepID=UPI002446413D|nr:uncharacterized protein LOC129594798 isoform X2 [Paramacrobiotus metropolitanus]